VAAELAPALLRRGFRQHRHPEIAAYSGGLGIPSLLKLLWLKSTFAAKTAVFILNLV